ncbi:MAG: UTRA domain-containing protein [Hydrogenophaga sp.]|uniref:GntR family transcriptional regulator n=1 Tax=Hydrogenophaga sp. TaxID=1904254 RepID=UPI0016AC0A57|nr:GntR family transcriptional regulator [Hydrogenophaga sp.]NIM41411.1 UTRA domain-containing protein [Hydrogenophaga sp.]NIN26727.1 UTRA domain-containing protein [Hydrogenophaga sp.]NIN30049.1 UTRA domain-containing protein [Hydrogenophaga sp.]NIN55657.1 UTRA domain-containing protein [Hydrogenophaga sp.]NIO52654.1 UTRA domain-containing protein [Hydrogenophaga sp.]
MADNPIPLYLQVADILRGRINKREWPAGTLIPTLEALAEEFKVARVTARQAVQLLTREGLLTPRRGHGTVVTKADDVPNTVVMSTSLESLASMYESTSAKMLTFDESHAMPTVEPGTGQLGSNYVYMRRLHFTENKPYAVIALYLLQEVFQRAPDEFRTRAVIPQLLRMKRTVRIERAQQTMSIGTADTDSAKLLQVRVGTPVAHVTRVFLDRNDRILYFAEVIYRGDWVKWEIELQT